MCIIATGDITAHIGIIDLDAHAGHIQICIEKKGRCSLDGRCRYFTTLISLQEDPTIKDILIKNVRLPYQSPLFCHFLGKSLGCPNFFGLLCKLWIKITRYFRMRERGKVLSNMNAKDKDAGAITHCTGDETT